MLVNDDFDLNYLADLYEMYDYELREEDLSFLNCWEDEDENVTSPKFINFESYPYYDIL